jgi:hypothetical protein
MFGKNGSLPQIVRAYYDPKSGSYWIPAGKRWTRVRNINTYLNLRCNTAKNLLSSQVLKVQEQHSLIYAGPLAGRQPGPIKTKNGIVLVTNGFDLIAPKEGDWSFIEALLTARLGEDVVHLYIYLKLGYEDLQEGTSLRV